MEKRREDNFDELAQKFFREMIKKGMENFPPRKPEGSRNPNFDDVFNKFGDIVERAKRGEPLFEVEAEEVEVTEEPKNENTALTKENELLKEQITLLQQQLKDKEEIISLLKAKQRSPRKKK